MPRFRDGDRVWVDKLKISGIVLSSFRTLDGIPCCVIQTRDRLIYISDEQQLDLVNSKIMECPHNSGFYFNNQHWYCAHECGYLLNFNPNKFPGGVTITNRRGVDKEAPPLVSSRA